MRQPWDSTADMREIPVSAMNRYDEVTDCGWDTRFLKAR